MNRLRQARLKIDVSQLELMQRTGIYFSTISRIERGWLNPTEEQKNKLAEALHVETNWLFPASNGNKS